MDKKNIVALNIKKIREVENLTQEDLANKLNLKRNSITLFESGKRKPSERTKQDICEKLNISLDWLETGEGDMYNKFGSVNEEDDFSKILGELSATENDSVKELFRRIHNMSPKKKAALLKVVEALIESDII